jgi:hypothetical protein
LWQVCIFQCFFEIDFLNTYCCINIGIVFCQQVLYYCITICNIPVALFSVLIRSVSWKTFVSTQVLDPFKGLGKNVMEEVSCRIWKDQWFLRLFKIGQSEIVYNSLFPKSRRDVIYIYSGNST